MKYLLIALLLTLSSSAHAEFNLFDAGKSMLQDYGYVKPNPPGYQPVTLTDAELQVIENRCEHYSNQPKIEDKYKYKTVCVNRSTTTLEAKQSLANHAIAMQAYNLKYNN